MLVLPWISPNHNIIQSLWRVSFLNVAINPITMMDPSLHADHTHYHGLVPQTNVRLLYNSHSVGGLELPQHTVWRSLQCGGSLPYEVVATLNNFLVSDMFSLTTKQYSSYIEKGSFSSKKHWCASNFNREGVSSFEQGKEWSLPRLA